MRESIELQIGNYYATTIEDDLYMNVAIEHCDWDYPEM